MSFFADHATSVTTTIVENVEIARDTMRVRVHVPDMVKSVVPGQFFMLRNPAGNDPLIGRAFALYDVDHEAGWVDLVYLVKGKLTTSLAVLGPGDPLAIWGPLGNGFSPHKTDHLIMVAGGIGQTPFLTLAREALGNQRFRTASDRPAGYAQRVTFCYGVRSAKYLAGVDQFSDSGCQLVIATEDGTQGPARRVTAPLTELLDNRPPEEATRIVCCGPEPMMEAVCGVASQFDIPCDVSLETPMACGIGICFTCVAKVRCDQGAGLDGDATDNETTGSDAMEWDYKRTCVEGPVFNSNDIVWS